jgi:hypothetical protein
MKKCEQFSARIGQIRERSQQSTQSQNEVRMEAFPKHDTMNDPSVHIPALSLEEAIILGTQKR